MISKKTSPSSPSLLLIGLIIIIIIMIIYLSYTSNKTYFNTESYIVNPYNPDEYTCTVNLNNIDPKFKDNYMKFDKKRAPDGKCKGAIINMNINTCPTDDNGSPISNCRQAISIVSSKTTTPVTYNLSIITTDNLKQFFGFY